MFFNVSLQGAASFPHILLRALGALYLVYHATFLGIRCLVFGVDQDRAEGVERLVVCAYSMLSENFGQFFRGTSDVG